MYRRKKTRTRRRACGARSILPQELRCPLGPARSFYDTPAACISSVSPTARTRRSSCLCCSVERTPHFIGRSSVSPAPCALSSTCVKTRLHWRTIAVDSHRRSALTATGNSQSLTHVLQLCAQRWQPHHDGCSLSGVLTITFLYSAAPAGSAAVSRASPIGRAARYASILVT